MKRAAAPLRALPKQEPRAEQRAYDTLRRAVYERAQILRKRFQAGDVVALVEALALPTVMPVGPIAVAADGTMAIKGPKAGSDTDVTVPFWALHAALAYVMRAVGGPTVADIRLPAPAKGGSSARFARRFRRELEDYVSYLHVEMARRPGVASFEGEILLPRFDAITATLSVENASAAVAARRHRSEDAVRKAYQRARRRLRSDPARYYVIGKLLKIDKPLSR